MTDRSRLSAITHGDVALHDPLDPRVVDEVLAVAALGPADRAVDLGCGPGELLVRLAAATGAGGLGVDLAEAQIAQARRRAAARAPGADLRFEVRAAEAVGGTFALAACVGSSHALGGAEPTLARLAELAAPGGHVLLGEGFWARRPKPAYLHALGGAREDELTGLSELVRAGARHDLVPVTVRVAGDEDWDRYEWTLIANGERFLHEHPDAPEAGDLRGWVDAARERVLGPGGRGTLGFALVLWCRPAR